MKLISLFFLLVISICGQSQKDGALTSFGMLIGKSVYEFNSQLAGVEWKKVFEDASYQLWEINDEVTYSVSFVNGFVARSSFDFEGWSYDSVVSKMIDEGWSFWTVCDATIKPPCAYYKQDKYYPMCIRCGVMEGSAYVDFTKF